MKYSKKLNGKSPNAMIVNTLTKRRIFRHVSKGFIPPGSFEQKYDNMWMHFLILEKNGSKKLTFRPIDKNEVGDKTISPTDVYVAKNCADEVREVYGISMPMTERIKWGIFIGLCVACLILIFLLTAMAGGK